MRLYQVHRTADGGCSAGYEYFANKQEANKAVRQWQRDNPKETAEWIVIEFSATKKGIRQAFNRYASHPDNG